jgi:hypothetical protein
MDVCKCVRVIVDGRVKGRKGMHVSQPPKSRDIVIVLHDAGHSSTSLVRPTIQFHGLFEIH